MHAEADEPARPSPMLVELAPAAWPLTDDPRFSTQSSFACWWGVAATGWGIKQAKSLINFQKGLVPRKVAVQHSAGEGVG